MKPFGILILIYIAVIMLSKKSTTHKYIALIGLLISLELFVDAGYIFKIGGYELLYSEFALIVVTLMSTYRLFYSPVRVKFLVSGFIFFCSILVTEIMLAIYPLNELIFRNYQYVVPQISVYSILITLRVFMMVIIALSLKTFLDRENLNKIIRYIYKFGLFIIAVCFVEWITKNIFQSQVFTDMVTLFFGNGESTVDFIFQRGDLYCLQGFTREPAHLVGGLFYYSLFIIFSNLEAKRVTRVLLCVAAILLLSGSFSSILYITCLIVILGIRRRISPYFLLLIPIIAVSMPLILDTELFQYYFLRVLNSLSFLQTASNELLITSEGYRINSVLQTFDIFLKRPIFGVGLGIPYSYGFLSQITASVGIVGFITWYIFVFKMIGGIKLNIKTFLIIASIFLAWILTGSIAEMYAVHLLLITCAIGQMYKNPDLIS